MYRTLKMIFLKTESYFNNNKKSYLVIYNRVQGNQFWVTV